MKRIISSILAIVMVLGTCMVPLADDSAGAAVPKIVSEIITADKSTKITITGTTAANSQVDLEVIREGKSPNDTAEYEFIYETISDSNGAYIFDFKTVNNTAQKFQVRIYTASTGTIYETEFAYSPAQIVIDTFDAVKAIAVDPTKTDNEVLATLAANKVVLGLDSALLNLMLSDTYNLDAEVADAARTIAGYTAADLTGFRSEYNQLLAISAVNKFNGDDLLNLFVDASNISVAEALGLTAGQPQVAALIFDQTKSIARNVRFNLMSDSVMQQVATYIEGKRPFTTITAIFNAFNEGVYLKELKNVEFYTQVDQVITNNSDLVARYADWAAITDDYGKTKKKQVVFDGKDKVNSIADADALISKAIYDGTHPDDQDNEPNNPPSHSGPGNVVITSTATPAAQPFDDLDSVPWAVEAVNSLAKEGVVGGKEPGKFVPNDNVTREEFAKMAVLAFGFKNATAIANFTDVPESSWSYMYVASASAAGIINGKGDGTFGASENITRADVAAICYRAGVTKNAPFASIADAGLNFTDKDSIPEYATKAVSVLTSAGALNGMGDGTFAPGATCTRAQAAKIIYEVSKLMK